MKEQEMIEELSTKIKHHSVLKNVAEREIKKLKERMILNSPYQVGDKVKAVQQLGGNVLYPGDTNYNPLEIKEVICDTFDGGKTWGLCYKLCYDKNTEDGKKYNFYVDVPHKKGKKKNKCFRSQKQNLFFEKDFLK